MQYYDIDIEVKMNLGGELDAYRYEAIMEKQAHKGSRPSGVVYRCFGHNLAHYLLGFRT
jgi:hypothetical protein